jgi:lipid A 4'-phosphatase
MINNRLVNISLIISGALTLVFMIYPVLDVAISSVFHETDGGFLYKNHLINSFLFRSVPIMTKLFVTGCIGYIVYLLVKYKSTKLLLKSGAFFLLISAAIGPGFVAHAVLKENFGRARPRDIVEFAGDKEFVRAGVISSQCTTNCSFVSGHAAMAFYFTTIAYIARTRYFNRIYLLGLIFGTCVGISHIIMGGHFASDVTAAAFIILFLNHLTYYLWRKSLK